MSLRPRATAVGVALASAALAVTTVAPADAHRRHGSPHYPAQIALPDGFLPEGITIGKAPVAYLGRVRTGTSTPPTCAPVRGG